MWYKLWIHIQKPDEPWPKTVSFDKGSQSLTQPRTTAFYVKGRVGWCVFDVLPLIRESVLLLHIKTLYILYMSCQSFTLGISSKPITVWAKGHLWQSCDNTRERTIGSIHAPVLLKRLLAWQSSSQEFHGALGTGLWIGKQHITWLDVVYRIHIWHIYVHNGYLQALDNHSWWNLSSLRCTMDTLQV